MWSASSHDGLWIFCPAKLSLTISKVATGYRSNAWGHSAPQPSAPPGAQDKAHPKSGAKRLAGSDSKNLGFIPDQPEKFELQASRDRFVRRGDGMLAFKLGTAIERGHRLSMRYRSAKPAPPRTLRVIHVLTTLRMPRRRPCRAATHPHTRSCAESILRPSLLAAWGGGGSQQGATADCRREPVSCCGFLFGNEGGSTACTNCKWRLGKCPLP